MLFYSVTTPTYVYIETSFKLGKKVELFQGFFLFIHNVVEHTFCYIPIIYSSPVFRTHIRWTYHWGVESGPAWPVHRATLVGLDFAGRDEELHLVWIRSQFHIRQSLGPSRGADQPHEGEHHCHHKVLRERRDRAQDTMTLLCESSGWKMLCAAVSGIMNPLAESV